jgi:hypothetical protein
LRPRCFSLAPWKSRASAVCFSHYASLITEIADAKFNYLLMPPRPAEAQIQLGLAMRKRRPLSSILAEVPRGGSLDCPSSKCSRLGRAGGGEKTCRVSNEHAQLAILRTDFIFPPAGCRFCPSAAWRYEHLFTNYVFSLSREVR